MEDARLFLYFSDFHAKIGVDYIRNTLARMDNLEYEIHVSGNDPYRGPEFEVDVTRPAAPTEEVTNDQSAVEFSVNLVKALQEKMQAHNKDGFAKVTNNQLKKVYRNGAYMFSSKDLWKGHFPDKGTGEWSMARVNMFLRMRKGDKFESNNRPITPGKFIDISESWCPTDEDFKQAREDIKNYNLNYTFKDIDELYLEEYQKVDFEY